mmetsp:Transcript_22790/g.53194  ORF Transcript_22790/g.53194 Transcript_22790/m.53194 type:complete len:972 (-) Transcript_22790:127-3042(-)
MSTVQAGQSLLPQQQQQFIPQDQGAVRSNLVNFIGELQSLLDANPAACPSSCAGGRPQAGGEIMYNSALQGGMVNSSLSSLPPPVPASFPCQGGPPQLGAHLAPNAFGFPGEAQCALNLASQQQSRVAAGQQGVHMMRQHPHAFADGGNSAQPQFNHNSNGAKGKGGGKGKRGHMNHQQQNAGFNGNSDPMMGQAGGALGTDIALSRKQASAAQVRLNELICEAANKQGTAGILNLVSQRHAEMSCVNLSTALHRLARLVKDRGRPIDKQGPAFYALRQATYIELEKQTQDPTQMAMPRCWATIAWSLATLQVHDYNTFNTIATLATPHVDTFNHLELTNLLWAFAKLQVANTPLFQAAHDHIVAKLRDFTQTNLSTIVWAYATVNHAPSISMLSQVAKRFVHGLQVSAPVSPVEISNFMWGLATTQLRLKPQVPREVGNAAVQILHDFKLQELSITAWAFSRLGVRHDGFFVAAAQRLRCSPDLRSQIHPQGISNLMWAFSKQVALRSKLTEILHETLLVLLPECTRLLWDLKPQEYSCVLLSLARMNVKYGDMIHADEVFTLAAGAKPEFLHTMSLQQHVHTFSAFEAFLSKNGDDLPVAFSNFQRVLASLCLQHAASDAGHCVSILELLWDAQSFSARLLQLVESVATLATRRCEDLDPARLVQLLTIGSRYEGQVAQMIGSAVASAILDQGLSRFSSQLKEQLLNMFGLDASQAHLLPRFLVQCTEAWPPPSATKSTAPANVSPAEASPAPPRPQQARQPHEDMIFQPRGSGRSGLQQPSEERMSKQPSSSLMQVPEDEEALMFQPQHSSALGPGLQHISEEGMMFQPGPAPSLQQLPIPDEELMFQPNAANPRFLPFQEAEEDVEAAPGMPLPSAGMLQSLRPDLQLPAGLPAELSAQDFQDLQELQEQLQQQQRSEEDEMPNYVVKNTFIEYADETTRQAEVQQRRLQQSRFHSEIVPKKSRLIG